MKDSRNKFKKIRRIVVYRIAWAAVKAFSAFIILLPFQWAQKVGACLGLTGYYIAFPERKKALRNLRSAFSKEKSETEIRRIARDCFRHMGISFTEFLFYPKMKKLGRDRVFSRLDGMEYLEEARSLGKGLIVLVSHVGNWELAAAFVPWYGVPFHIVTYRQVDYGIEAILNEYRSIMDVSIIPKERAVNEIARALGNNHAVGIAIDLNAKRTGVFVDFFGKPASTFSGISVLARRTGAPILPGLHHRHADGSHHIEVLPPYQPVSTGNFKKDIQTDMANMTRILENYIRKHPEQWIWMYNRWKTQP